MTIAIFSGSFDPFTNGHLDILKRSSAIFDKVIIAVAYNCNKTGLIPFKDRGSLILECIKDLNNVELDIYEGLTSQYAKQKGAKVLIRSVRNSIDLEYEKQIALTNHSLNEDLETVFFIANPKYEHISSSVVKEIYHHKGDISKFVPSPVYNYLKSSK
jgi:pantetheine-phosphate adenylyltransferase